jgi:two-component system, OmpR family, response regulator QseB
MNVLLIEDDPLVGEGIRVGLSLKGMTVDWVQSGADGARALAHSGFDAAILDLALPRRSGLELLREHRGSGGDLPVLVLTAFDAVDERVAGLDAGADDYMTKPFDLEELAARLRALQRRIHGRASNAIRHGGLCFDTRNLMVTVDGEPVALSRREAVLLQLLLENRGRVVSNERIQDRLYGWSEGVESNAAAVHIHNLRRKLGRALIETVRGLGYRVPGESG